MEGLLRLCIGEENGRNNVGGSDWSSLTQDNYHWRALVNTAIIKKN
jgi:hypothetical protein